MGLLKGQVINAGITFYRIDINRCEINSDKKNIVAAKITARRYSLRTGYDDYVRRLFLRELYIGIVYTISEITVGI